MKKNFVTLAAVIALIVVSMGFISCRKEEKMDTSVSIMKLFDFGYKEETFDISIPSNTNVILDNPSEWIIITKTGEKEEQIFHCTVLENETTSSRTGKITYNQNLVSVLITVWQSGKSE